MQTGALKMANEHALELVTQAGQVLIEAGMQLNRELTSDELFELRIELQDACDTIRAAGRMIEQLQRELDRDLV